MVAAGMTPAEVIVAATSAVAAVVGLDGSGTVAESYSADFIVLDAIPSRTSTTRDALTASICADRRSSAPRCRLAGPNGTILRPAGVARFGDAAKSRYNVRCGAFVSVGVVVTGG